jgi:GT2 family glycosyltransferase
MAAFAKHTLTLCTSLRPFALFFRTAMQLSVIIVNYNVKHFLEQCLAAVRLAAKGLELEVLVVDNNSSDGSVAYLQPLYPEVRFIALDHNPGFAKANNLAFQQCSGRYVLFLNPDTIIAEDTLSKTLMFMEAHPDAGALGIRMIDGSGRFLPESKRGFPSPFTSFCKQLGLHKLFPHSKIFARYYLGHLPNHETNEVEVLAGAFMLLRKDVLDSVGSFDEQFFMYGEDIDLSYRITLAGWKNYFFADSTIIHFKGESTAKQSLQYVKVFYQAMLLFVKKHFHGRGALLYRLLLYAGIALRGMLGAITRLFAQRETQPSIPHELKLQFHGSATAALPSQVKLGNEALPLLPDATAQQHLLCIGSGWPASAAIQWLEQHGAHSPCWLHVQGTGSMVLSKDKNRAGLVAVFPR